MQINSAVPYSDVTSVKFEGTLHCLALYRVKKSRQHIVYKLLNLCGTCATEKLVDFYVT